MEVEVLDRGDHGHRGASISQVDWLFIVFVCVHHAMSVEVRRRHRILWAGVTGACELLDVGAGI